MNRTPTASVTLFVVTAILIGCGEEPEVPTIPPPEPQSSAAVVSAVNAPAHAGEASAEQPATLPRIDLAGVEAMVVEAAAADRVLVIDFWATWCVPCVEMFPAIHEGITALGEGVRLASVSIDGESREQAAIDFLTEQHALNNAYLMPDPKDQEATVDGLGERWTNVAVPAILVFDRQGQLAGEFLEGGKADDVIALAQRLHAAPGE